jgi:hypothetical protein
MRTHAESIEIAAPPDRVHAFLADPEKLPVWAIGFAKAIEHAADGWVVTTASGDRVGIRVVSDPEHGIVDYVMSPTPGVEVAARTRVVAANGGALYTFAMLQAPGMPDAVFDQQVSELKRELTVLKAHLETACPL